MPTQAATKPAAKTKAKKSLAATFGLAAVQAAPEGFMLEDTAQSKGSYKVRMKSPTGDYVHVVVIVDGPNNPLTAI